MKSVTPQQTPGRGTDFSPLTAFAGSDAQAARSILVSFAGQAEADCAAFESALDARDTAKAKALAHKMLPIFTMLGAEPPAGTLRRMETSDGELSEELLAAGRAAAGAIRAIVEEARRATESAAETLSETPADSSADFSAESVQGKEPPCEEPTRQTE